MTSWGEGWERRDLEDFLFTVLIQDVLIKCYYKLYMAKVLIIHRPAGGEAD